MPDKMNHRVLLRLTNISPIHIKKEIPVLYPIKKKKKKKKSYTV